MEFLAVTLGCVLPAREALESNHLFPLVCWQPIHLAVLAVLNAFQGLPVLRPNRRLPGECARVTNIRFAQEHHTRDSPDEENYAKRNQVGENHPNDSRLFAFHQCPANSAADLLRM